MTPTDVQRKSRWLQVSIPVRVLSFDLENFEAGGFSEDAPTLFVSPRGASITLRHAVTVGDFLRIINLVNLREADFRVVGTTGCTEDGSRVWALESLDLKDAFWGIQCEPPGAEDCDPAFLQCRSCSDKANRSLTVVELEVFHSAGILILNCVSCGRPTYWVDADPDRRPHDFSAVEAIAPPLRVDGWERTNNTKNEKVERRAAKRSGMKLPALVRSPSGSQELSTTIGLSKSGACVTLFMTLEVGATVKMICPYDARLGGIEQTAEVRWRSVPDPNFPRTYGFRFIR